MSEEEKGVIQIHWEAVELQQEIWKLKMERENFRQFSQPLKLTNEIIVVVWQQKEKIFDIIQNNNFSSLLRHLINYEH